MWVRYVREVDERGVQGRAALAAMYAAARLLRCAEGHAVARVLPSGALGVLDAHVLGGARAVLDRAAEQEHSGVRLPELN